MVKDLYMENIVCNLWRTLIFSVVFLIPFTSCESVINEDYDLGKEIDMTASVLQGVSVPIGNAKTLSVSDVLELENVDGNVICSDEEGDLKIVVEDHMELKVPTNVFAFGCDLPDSRKFEKFTIDFPHPGVNIPENQLQGQTFSYSDLTGSPLSVSTAMNFESALPAEVKDVRYIDFYGDLTLNFDSSVNAYLKSGFKIIFPEYVMLQNYNQKPEFNIDANYSNVVELVEDVAVPGKLTFNFNRIYVPEGSISDGKLNLNLEVRFEGDMSISGEDLIGVTANPQIVVSMEDFSFNPTSAELKVDYEYVSDNIDIQIEGVPDFLTDNALSIDLENPLLYLQIHNWTTFGFNIQAGITAHHSSHSTSVTFGEDPRIDIAPDTRNTIVFSTLPVEEISGEEIIHNIVDPSIEELFSEIPEKISLHDIKVKFFYDYFDVGLNYESYLMDFNYRLELPMVFGENLQFAYIYDVDVEDVDFEAVVDNAVLDLDLINSIPLSFDLEVQAIDTDGHPIDWLKFDITPGVRVASGKQNAPVTTHLSLNFKSEREYIQFSGLRYKITATAPSPEHLGVSLNKNQKIEFNNLSLSIPEGISINL